MIQINLLLDGCTMKDLRRFVEMTTDEPDDYEPFLPDYSADHPAMLRADDE